jgi:hypothetical protein
MEQQVGDISLEAMQNRLFLNRKQGNNFPEDKSNALLIFQIINVSEHGCLHPQFSIVYVKTGLKQHTHTTFWIFCRLTATVKC